MGASLQNLEWKFRYNHPLVENLLPVGLTHLKMSWDYFRPCFRRYRRVHRQ